MYSWTFRLHIRTRSHEINCWADTIHIPNSLASSVSTSSAVYILPALSDSTPFISSASNSSRLMQTCTESIFSYVSALFAISFPQLCLQLLKALQCTLKILDDIRCQHIRLRQSVQIRQGFILDSEQVKARLVPESPYFLRALTHAARRRSQFRTTFSWVYHLFPVYIRWFASKYRCRHSMNVRIYKNCSLLTQRRR